MTDDFDYSDDAQPTFNNLDGTRSNDTRKRRPHSSSSINILPVGDKEETQEIEQLIPPCHVCHNKRTQYDTIVESVVCNACGNIESVSIDTLMNEQRQISSQTNPYTPVKPSMISFSPSSLANYEDIHKQDNEVYKGSSQDALRQEYEKFKRRQNDRSWFS